MRCRAAYNVQFLRCYKLLRLDRCARASISSFVTYSTGVTKIAPRCAHNYLYVGHVYESRLLTPLRFIDMSPVVSGIVVVMLCGGFILCVNGFRTMHTIVGLHSFAIIGTVALVCCFCSKLVRMKK